MDLIFPVFFMDMSNFLFFKISHYQFISAYSLYFNINTILYLFPFFFFFTLIFSKGIFFSLTLFCILFLDVWTLAWCFQCQGIFQGIYSFVYVTKKTIIETLLCTHSIIWKGHNNSKNTYLFSDLSLVETRKSGNLREYFHDILNKLLAESMQNLALNVIFLLCF